MKSSQETLGSMKSLHDEIRFAGEIEASPRLNEIHTSPAGDFILASARISSANRTDLSHTKCGFNCFGFAKAHSHSIVPVGLGVIS